MIRFLSFLPLLTAVLLLPSCGGGGESGDNMRDFWVSARRFANGTKRIKLINGPGSMVITPLDSGDIGPDADDPKDDENNPASVNINKVSISTSTPADGTFTGTGVFYETDPEAKTAILRMENITSNLWSGPGMEGTRRLVELFGGIGRIVLPNGTKVYYHVKGRVTIFMDFNRGSWAVEGQSTYTPIPDLFVPNGSLSVVPAY